VWALGVLLFELATLRLPFTSVETLLAACPDPVAHASHAMAPIRSPAFKPAVVADAAAPLPGDDPQAMLPGVAWDVPFSLGFDAKDVARAGRRAAQALGVAAPEGAAAVDGEASVGNTSSTPPPTATATATSTMICSNGPGAAPDSAFTSVPPADPFVTTRARGASRMCEAGAVASLAPFLAAQLDHPLPAAIAAPLVAFLHPDPQLRPSLDEAFDGRFPGLLAALTAFSAHPAATGIARSDLFL
jgi:hypothetical protein